MAFRLFCSLFFTSSGLIVYCGISRAIVFCFSALPSSTSVSWLKAISEERCVNPFSQCSCCSHIDTAAVPGARTWMFCRFCEISRSAGWRFLVHEKHIMSRSRLFTTVALDVTTNSKRNVARFRGWRLLTGDVQPFASTMTTFSAGWYVASFFCRLNFDHDCRSFDHCSAPNSRYRPPLRKCGRPIWR